MFRAYLFASLNVLRRRRLAMIPAAALAVALPLAGVAMTQSPHAAASAHRGMGIADPALAAEPPSPTPTPPQPPSADAAPGSGAAVHPVRLPLLTFAGSESGPAPAPRAGSRLVVPSVGLQVGVVDYADCSGNSPMTRASAVHFRCSPTAVSTFVGHNPGVFTPLLRTEAGDRVLFQHDGVQDTWVFSARYRVSPQEASNYAQDGSYEHAVFATCAEPDSSAYWIFIATPSGTGSGGEQRASGTSQSGQGQPKAAPSPSPSPSPNPGGGLPGGVTLPPPPPPPI